MVIYGKYLQTWIFFSLHREKSLVSESAFIFIVGLLDLTKNDV